MKKVLTILVIMAIVVGTAFAASEQHKIKIKADVIAVVPVFQLELGDVVTNNAAKPTVFTDRASYTPNSTDTAVDAGFKLDVGGFVTVTVKLANAAKQKQSYTLTFSDGEFKDVMRDGDSGVKTPTIAAKAETASNNGISSIAVDSQDAKKLKVNFNGSTAVVGNLGTATYTYGPDDKIDPGTYYADIVLTISVG